MSKLPSESTAESASDARCIGSLCPIDQVQQDHRSIGVVDGEELVCREAYDPINHNGTEIRPALVRMNHLYAGTLSAWRLTRDNNIEKDRLLSQAQARLPPNKTNKPTVFAGLACVPAKTIRSISDIHGKIGRLVVVDECDTDDEGGFDSMHIHVSPCRRLLKSYGVESVEFTKIRDELFRAFQLGEFIK